MNDDFYIGYDPQMPSSYARAVRPVVGTLLALGCAVPLLLVYAHGRSGDGVFEYGAIRPFEGVVIERPYPLLDTGDSLALLVAPFKVGAAGLVEGFDGRRVRLSGTLIHQDGVRMIEVRPGSVEPVGADGATARTALVNLGPAVVTGEIVDPKCYLGVMKPSTRQVHRDCAVRCLSGGIPPMLVADVNGGGHNRLLLLDRSGAPLRAPLERLVGRPVSLSGTLLTMRGLRFLAVEGVE